MNINKTRYQIVFVRVIIVFIPGIVFITKKQEITDTEFIELLNTKSTVFNIILSSSVINFDSIIQEKVFKGNMLFVIKQKTK